MNPIVKVLLPGGDEVAPAMSSPVWEGEFSLTVDLVKSAAMADASLPKAR
jgi:hypothetical protein